MNAFRLALLVLLGFVGSTYAQQAEPEASAKRITILEWNVEAGGADVTTILEQLDALKPFDILALSEVPQGEAARFTNRWSADSSLLGAAGGNARLMIAWNPEVFTKVKAEEMKQFEGRDFAPGIQPAPLVIELKHKASGQSMIVIMNHLTRGSAELRKTQALLLVEWAKKQTLPIIGIGGYNFDYDFVKHKGNESFDAFLATDTWSWIKPKQWHDTNWADRNRDGKDDYPDSMLDYTFVAGGAKKWKVTSEVVVRPGDFPDTDKTSDHRPIRAVIELNN